MELLTVPLVMVGVIRIYGASILLAIDVVFPLALLEGKAGVEMNSGPGTSDPSSPCTAWVAGHHMLSHRHLG